MARKPMKSMEAINLDREEAGLLPLGQTRKATCEHCEWDIMTAVKVGGMVECPVCGLYVSEVTP